MWTRTTSTVAGGLFAGALIVALSSGTAAAADKKLTLAVPGIPPIFASVIAIVADQQGYFKKHGADVEVKYFESGTAAERAVVTGGVDLGLSPTPLVIAQNSNAGVDLVGIYGMPNPDFLIATTDPGRASCKDLIGQPVGVDAVGGARATALAQMLGPCGVKIERVQQVVLPSSATTSAMISDHLTFGVIHADEIAVLETQGKKVGVITTIAKASPNSHFAMIVARRKDLEAGGPRRTHGTDAVGVQRRRAAVSRDRLLAGEGRRARPHQARGAHPDPGEERRDPAGQDARRLRPAGRHHDLARRRGDGRQIELDQARSSAARSPTRA